jgi:hypothetical protein
VFDRQNNLFEVSTTWNMLKIEQEHVPVEAPQHRAPREAPIAEADIHLHSARTKFRLITAPAETVLDSEGEEQRQLTIESRTE